MPCPVQLLFGQTEMDRWDFNLQFTRNKSKNTVGRIRLKSNLLMVYSCVPFGMAIWSMTPVICGWTNYHVIAASSVTCAHTQRDGQDTVSLGETHMDGCNK